MSTQSAGGFDLSAAKPVAELEDEGVWVNLRDGLSEQMYYTDGNGEKKPVRVLVAGTYSNVYRKAQDAQTERNLKRRAKTVNADAVNRERMALTVACVLDWEGMFANGSPLPCDKEMVAAVLTQAPWIREQVEEQMTDHESFFKKS